MSGSEECPNKETPGAALSANSLISTSKCQEDVSMSKTIHDPITTLQSMADDDVWDDTILLKSYQKGVKMVDAAIKKKKSLDKSSRTKSPQVTDEGLQSQSTTNSESKETTSRKVDRRVNDHAENKDKNKLKYLKYNHESVVTTYRFNPIPGKYCRCPFSEDGKDYEAVILKVYPSDDSVLLRYIGYENEEVRSISMLKDSAGEQARVKQTQMAENEFCDTVVAEGEDTEEEDSERLDCAIQSSSKTSNPIKRPKSGRDHHQNRKEPLKESGASIPCPPPFVGMPGNHGREEDEALASMLMSWYMSGYHTGYYQAMKKYRK